MWVIYGDVKAPRQEFHATMDKTVRLGLQTDREMLGETETVQTKTNTTDYPTIFDSLEMGGEQNCMYLKTCLQKYNYLIN